LAAPLAALLDHLLDLPEEAARHELERLPPEDALLSGALARSPRCARKLTVCATCAESAARRCQLLE
jgi:hypothetical protein